MRFRSARRPGRAKRARKTSALVLSLAVGAGGCGGSPTGPVDDGDDPTLPAAPVLISPVGGMQVTTDRPTFTVQNARRFNTAQSQYTFELASRSGRIRIASATVAAGRGTTSLVFPGPVPRGMDLTWTVTARGPAGESTAGPAAFRGPAVECPSVRGAHAKSVVEWSVPACSLARNAYNDPEQVLGPPDATRASGYMSLGEKGHVTVDMGGCFVDGTGDDLRVYQAVSDEPVTVYVAGSPDGPFVRIGERERCGVRSGGGVFSNHCTFDLATGEVSEARYVRVEDGEHFPCDRAETDSEGADIDAVQMLNRR